MELKKCSSDPQEGREKKTEMKNRKQGNKIVDLTYQ